MATTKPVFLFTDFGAAGPYIGQSIAAILAVDAGISVVDLMHDAPAMRPDLAAYLLPAVCRPLPVGAVVVAVVDPGVGSDRRAVVVETDRLTLVGPDNGLMARVPWIRHAARIDWRPSAISTSFHGRDLFAPVAAQLAADQHVDTSPLPANTLVGADWPADLPAIVYIDAYGNAMTGIDADKINRDNGIVISGQRLTFAATFSESPPGEAFWYCNSQGLVEIAVNRGSAAETLSLALGDRFLVD